MEQIIIDNKYFIKEFNTKIVVVDKDDNKMMALVTTDFYNKTNTYWINYKKLKSTD